MLLNSDWLPYLNDIAFQKYVVQNAFPDCQVKAHLILADKDQPCTVDGLHQRFRIDADKKITVMQGTTRASLGSIPLTILPIDRECQWIYDNPVQVDLDGECHFVDLIEFFSEKYHQDERIWSRLGRKCRDCQYQSTDSSLKSGFEECWKHLAGFREEDFKKPLTLELWGGKAGAKSIIDNLVRGKKYFLSEVEETDYFPKNQGKPIEGLSPAARRREQIVRRCSSQNDRYLDKKGLARVFDSFEKPFHFIDFETSAMALPFYRGRRPYEAVAFQYSYHLMHEDGRIEHKGDYLSLDDQFPNYAFVRALKADLEGKGGTIFRYHQHENNYLNAICRQLEREEEDVISDRNELIHFIKEITHRKGEEPGPRDMQDLWELVLSYYYSPFAKGSNSIKHILPSVIQHSAFIREKYAEPVYGTSFIPSRNFTAHAWIQQEADFNPYNTLPKVLEDYKNELLEDYVGGPDELKDGGAAMMAYAYLQFTGVPEFKKEAIRQALLRYCELDTMAMVMIWEYWGREIGFFK